MRQLIRSATPADLEAIIDLCAAHAKFEQAAYDRTGKKEALSSDIFAADPKVQCIVVEVNGSIIAYATFMKQYSTWDATDYVYMDCLFVTDAARGQGIGEQLIKAIQSQARAWGCTLIQWQTPDFNTRAMKFYRRLGATSKPKERFFLEV